MLTRRWLISAAHCAGNKELISSRDCGSSLRVHIRCVETPLGDLRVIFVGEENVAKIYYGMHNIKEKVK